MPMQMGCPGYDQFDQFVIMVNLIKAKAILDPQK